MALIKVGYTNGAGVSAEYWKIIDYKINTQLKYVDITLGGWLNEECRVANMELADTPKKVRCMKDKFELYFSTEILNGTGINMLLQMYKFAKENSEFFLDATDKLDPTNPGEPVIPIPSLVEALQLQIDTNKIAIDYIALNY